MAGAGCGRRLGRRLQEGAAANYVIQFPDSLGLQEAMQVGVEHMECSTQAALNSKNALDAMSLDQVARNLPAATCSTRAERR